MTSSTACKYQPGTTVEVAVCDFRAAGMPMVWAAAQVVSVTVEGKLFDVAVQVDGRPMVVRVGSRGGNGSIRVAA